MNETKNNMWAWITAILGVMCLLGGLTIFHDLMVENELRRTNVTLTEHTMALEQDKAVLSRRIIDAESNLAAAERRIAELEGMVSDLTGPLPEPDPTAYDELGWDFDYVVRVVGAEARGEPMDGILAVAQCIADTAEATGMTPEQVVRVPGQYTDPVGRNVTDGMESVNEACLRVFVAGERPFDEPIRWFYAYKNGYSSWHEGQVYCFTIGGHRYFKAG